MLIGIALFRLHAQGRRACLGGDVGWQSGFIDVEQLRSGKCPPTWPAWFTYIRAVVGFGFNGVHAATRQHAGALLFFFFLFFFGSALRVKSWHFRLSTALRGS